MVCSLQCTAPSGRVQCDMANICNMRISGFGMRPKLPSVSPRVHRFYFGTRPLLSFHPQNGKKGPNTDRKRGAMAKMANLRYGPSQKYWARAGSLDPGPSSPGGGYNFQLLGKLLVVTAKIKTVLKFELFKHSLEDKIC